MEKSIYEILRDHGHTILHDYLENKNMNKVMQEESKEGIKAITLKSIIMDQEKNIPATEVHDLVIKMLEAIPEGNRANFYKKIGLEDQDALALLKTKISQLNKDVKEVKAAKVAAEQK